MTKPNTAAAAASAAPPPPPPADAPPASGPNGVAHAPVVDMETRTSEAPKNGTLGDQVHPDTMLREDDGNRTLAHPRVDPGPVQLPNAVNVQAPDRAKGEHRYGDVNDTVPVTMRRSTGHSEGFGRHSGDVVGETKLAADNFVSGAASDTYHPEGRENKNLTDQAAKNAAKPRDLAPAKE